MRSAASRQSPDLETLHEWDRLHVLHPWEAMDDYAGYDTMMIDRADGIYLWDGQGRKFIDGPAGMWCVQIGYGREEMAQAIADQARRMPYTSPFSNTTEPSTILAKKMVEMAPKNINTVFFTTGGSTAVDTALRTMHFMNNRLGRPDKKIVIAREKGYHGSTYLAHSVTGKERNKNKFDTEGRLVRFLPDVNPYHRPKGMSVEEWCDEKVNDLQRMIDEVGADRIGAFIAEPILASGGVIVPPPGYHKRTFDICKANDILYISDEVVTGFGRLGHWFSSEPVFGIQPDMITCAKGLTSGYLPLGACLISDEIMRNCYDPEDPALFTNGYTYSAHPVSCAAALKNIEIFEDEKILEHVREVTPHFQTRLKALSKFDIVGDTRGMGLLGCIDGKCDPALVLQDNAKTAEQPDRKLAADSRLGQMICDECEKLGLLVRPSVNMAVFSPPLIITKEQIDEMFDILEQALTNVETLLRGG